jgi:hypothetical protein
MNKLIAFGDSFTWGSELQDVIMNKDIAPSVYTWPALFAKYSKLEYNCLARPGSSNHTIARTILDNLHVISKNDIVIINWTWINRWDFYNLKNSDWCTVRPSSDVVTIFDRYYYKYFQSELWDKFESLKVIALIHNVLRDIGVRFIATSIDALLLDTKFHSPKYITVLQDKIGQDIKYFNSLGFYQWAKHNKFKIGKDGHPLEDAHLSAHEYAKRNF